MIGQTVGNHRITRLLVVLGLVAAGVSVGALAIRHLRWASRGKLALQLKPVDAKVLIDGHAAPGHPPVIERPAGTFQLSVLRDGYERKDQTVRLEAGKTRRLDVELEPSPDTGLELVSEPPGALAWLDGQPFTGPDPSGPQARTNFRALRIAPGRHVIELKGDPRFADWRQEVFQVPGKILRLRAVLVPRPQWSGPPKKRNDPGDFAFTPNKGDARSVTQEQIHAVVSEHRGAIKLCHERALERDETFGGGRVDVKLAVGGIGRVKSVAITAPPQVEAAVGGCLKASITRWRFPAIHEEYETEFPLILQDGRRP